MKFDEMKYERPDFDSLSQKMNAYVDQLEQAENAEAFLKTFFALNKERIHLQTMIIL